MTVLAARHIALRIATFLREPVIVEDMVLLGAARTRCLLVAPFSAALRRLPRTPPPPSPYIEVSYCSDYFGILIAHARQLIAKGLASVDETPQAQRPFDASPWRSRLAAQSQSLFTRMLMVKGMAQGDGTGGEQWRQCLVLRSCCVRRSTDIILKMKRWMRDPVLFHCSTARHPRTKQAYKAFPTYDFASALLDAHQGVTHAILPLSFRERSYPCVLRVRAPLAPATLRPLPLMLSHPHTLHMYRCARWPFGAPFIRAHAQHSPPCPSLPGPHAATTCASRGHEGTTGSSVSSACALSRGVTSAACTSLASRHGNISRGSARRAR